MQPTDNPYGLQRPPFPPSAPYPVAQVPPAPLAAPQPTAVADPRARTAAIVLFACCAAMLVGIGSFQWFSRGDSGVGLGGVQECVSHGCHTTMWSDLKRAPADYALFGYLGVLAMAAAIGLSIHAGVVLLRRPPAQVKVTALNACLGVSAFCTVFFWMRIAFGELGHKLAIGYTGFVAIAGILVSGAMVRWIRTLST